MGRRWGSTTAAIFLAGITVAPMAIAAPDTVPEPAAAPGVASTQAMEATDRTAAGIDRGNVQTALPEGFLEQLNLEAASSTLGQAYAPPGGIPFDATERALALEALRGDAPTPPAPDPMISTTVDRDPAEYRAWDRWRASQTYNHRQDADPAASGYSVDEASGANDRIGQAQTVNRKGDDVLEIRGTIAPMPAIDQPVPAEGVSCEDGGSDGTENGSIADYPCDASTLLDNGSVSADARIGNGTYGNTSGDFDVYHIGSYNTGQAFSVQMQATGGSLDPAMEVVAVHPDGTDGTVPTLADNISRTNANAFLSYRVPPALDGWDFYVFAEASGSFPTNPTDASSGTGATTTGPYTISFWRRAVDIDNFSVALPANTLAAADAFGSANTVGMFTPGGDTLRVGQVSGEFLSFPAHTANEPLADLDANALITQFSNAAGRYVFQVAGAPGDYTLRIRVIDRTGAERRPGTRQRVFLDFDGHTMTPSNVFDGANDSQVTFSPLADFLVDFGLSPAHEDAVIDATVQRFENAFDRVLARHGGQRDVVILNSRDHTFGRPGHTARVVIGGTQPQLGVPTIGLAESVDPGNMELGDFSVVLLDVLMQDGIPDNDQDDPGLIDLAATFDEADRATIAGVSIGSIAAHEFGHLLGNWHTEFDPDHNGAPHPDNQRFGVVPNIMDRGGDLETMFGVGLDGTFGTSDDLRAQFPRKDVYEFNEGFLGTEDTLVTTAEALAWLTPTDTVVLGGEAAVTNSVQTAVIKYFAGDDTRHAGTNRYETAAKVVAADFPGTSDVVYLATGGDFPDALAGAAAAAAENAPVLLTGTDTLPQPTIAQLRRLKPKRVVITGGEAAVSADVERQVEQTTGARIARRAGTNRYETAALIVRNAFPDTERVVYVATGTAAPDALAGAAAAAREGAPVLLVAGDALPGAIQTELERLDPDIVRVLGGEAAVSQKVAKAIDDATGARLDRLGGTDRFETASLVINRAFPKRVEAVYVATGRGFADALAGAAAAATRRAPVILTERDSVPGAIADRMDVLSDF